MSPDRTPAEPVRSLTVEEYAALAPDDAEWARAAVEPYRDMTPDERLQALAALNAWVETLLDDREAETADGEEPFWMHWRDPDIGRPR